jgi:putative transposase
MPSSYVSSHFHIVFSTKDRERIISEKFQPKLWAYMAGIATNHGMHALAIGLNSFCLGRCDRKREVRE